jgi:hypothetical protein
MRILCKHSYEKITRSRHFSEQPALDVVHLPQGQEKAVSQPLKPSRIFCISSFSPDIEIFQNDPAGTLAFSPLFGSSLATAVGNIMPDIAFSPGQCPYRLRASGAI